MKTAIFDIDDTLIDSKWNGFIHSIVDKLKELKSKGYCIVILTNRDKNSYLETKNDLSSLSYDYLFLRDSKKFKVNENVEFKKSIVLSLILKDHIIEYFFDDQDDNLMMAIELKIPNVIKVENGKFEEGRGYA
jgi:hydroxymethylpyrimidine pyrophosphatase-like HAD family hydrolase